jgi:hypothetical protein
MCLSDLGNRPIIGIDPGASGGIAWIDGNGMNAIKMPEERPACRYLYRLIDAFHLHSPHIYIEKVFISPRQASMVSYVSRYGSLIGAIFAHTSTFPEIYEVPPLEWQAHYPELATKLLPLKKGSPRGELKDAKAERRREIKSLSREIASTLYPHLAPLLKPKSSDGIADAVLICLYGCYRALSKI